MRNNFNEATFQTCFNAEIIERYRHVLEGVPTTLTQREEWRRGYDTEVRIRNGNFTKSYFLQYKISNFIQSGRRVPRIGAFPFYSPCYRYPITKINKSPQHNLLFSLESSGEAVFYCAPCFHQNTQLYAHMVDKRVIESSRLFSPVEMGQIRDDDQHYVYFDINGTQAFFCSEPIKLSLRTFWGITEDSNRSVRTINEGYLNNLHNKINGIVTDVLDIKPAFPKAESKVGQIAYMLERYFKLEWILI